jgi:hypothetical protein
MDKPLPLRNRIVEISLSVPQKLFPVAPGVDIPGQQIPVSHGITGKEILPTIQTNISTVSRISLNKQLFNPIRQPALPGTACNNQQLPQLRLTLTAKYFL